MVILTDYLATWWNAKITAELWESEIWVGPFCDPELAKSTVKVCVWGMISHLWQIFFPVINAFETVSTSKMTQTERTEKKGFLCFVCIMY